MLHFVLLILLCKRNIAVASINSFFFYFSPDFTQILNVAHIWIRNFRQGYLSYCVKIIIIKICQHCYVNNKMSQPKEVLCINAFSVLCCSLQLITQNRSLSPYLEFTLQQQLTDLTVRMLGRRQLNLLFYNCR